MMQDNHIFQGMRRDNHPIRQEKQFLWDARNIRLTNREDDTLLSITNEKGTLPTDVSFAGDYVGHCVVDKYLVVFTVEGDTSYIYRVEKKDSGYEKIELFSGDLGFSTEHPIESLGIYESELIQKVYWIDGKHQPRFINIVKDPEKANYTKTSFDFIQTLELNEEVTVTKSYGAGMFAPGVIQYAFTYYDKYGAESNIFYTTGLQYLSFSDRGAKADEKVANSFTIVIDNVDSKFNYIRMYSIHRTSIDAEPTVKRVTDVPITGTTVTITDRGDSGDIIDPYQLLYIGGRNIIASTIAQKDNTLFLGDITLVYDEEWENVKSLFSKEIENEGSSSIVWKDYNLKEISNGGGYSQYYFNSTNLDTPNIFKSRDVYRCGIQFQDSKGIWSEPIFIGDKVIAETYPQLESGQIIPKSKSVRLSSELCGTLEDKGYIKARLCIVVPSSLDRKVICQGVLCPTVFKIGNRGIGEGPYTQSSWFFRPAQPDISDEINLAEVTSTRIQYQHNKSLYTAAMLKDDPTKGAEIQGMTKGDYSYTSSNNNTFCVDENIVTFHSPDIEFDSNFPNINLENTRLRVLGVASLDAIIGDIDIETSSPVAAKNLPGFNHRNIGYSIGYKYKTNGGLTSGLFYSDGVIKNAENDYNVVGTDSTGMDYLVYPWHRSGSLNNDESRGNEGTRTAVLRKKKISNLKFFSDNIPIAEPKTYNIGAPQLFYSNELEISKIEVPYINSKTVYMGNIDTMLTYSEYPIYGRSRSIYSVNPPSNVTINKDIDEIEKNSGYGDIITKSSDPVRLKYKSTPHIVLSLKGDSNDKIELLPKLNDGNEPVSGSFKLPPWASKGDVFENNLSPGNVLRCITLEGYKRSSPSSGYCYCVDSMRLYAAVNKTWQDITNLVVNGDKKTLLVKGDGTFEFYQGAKIDGVLEPTGLGQVGGMTYRGNNIWLEVVVESSDRNNPKVKLERVEPSRAEDIEEETSITDFTLNQEVLNSATRNPYLILAELVKEDNGFNEPTNEILRSHLWIPAGEPVRIEHLKNDGKELAFTYGDTWYARYDCLKTYAFTPEDENQVVEIGSFMCETRVNINGRTDRNRGLISNINMSPINFNLFNEVYSQKNTFFNYRIYDEDYYKNNSFPNQITWSTTKLYNSDVDSWTNITLASTIDLDGTSGRIRALRTWNDSLLCFQDKAVNNLLFNSRVQIQASDGVPIEIANGGKMEGNRVLTNNIGCSNKWSIIDTANGVYFMDPNTNSLYLFGNNLSNISNEHGMDWWVKSIPNKEWLPTIKDDELGSIRAFHDNKFGDVYFTPNFESDALCYSEKLGQFTSFMSYGGTQAMFNFANGFYSLRKQDGYTKLFENNAGEYNDFYGEPKGWSLSFISNDNPTVTKIFDNIEMRADCYSPSELLGDKYSTNVQTGQPFNYIRVDNEYQDTEEVMFDTANLRKKFRIWRALIPRNKNSRERIRNPWAKITLGMENPGNTMTMLHDLSVGYTI